MSYTATEAGKQIERALEQGYDVAAFKWMRRARGGRSTAKSPGS
jgi:hypothetical protein